MKKTLFILLLAIAFVSCKNEKSSNNTDDSLTTLKGEFVYYEDAAILNTNTEIYGVLITDKTKELNQLAEQYKTKPTDMVQVEVRGEVSKKSDPKILWENKFEIKEIISVKAIPKQDETAL